MRILGACALVLACLAVGTAAGARRLRLHKPGRGFQMRMAPFVIPPAAEREVCEYRTTPNGKPMDVQGFELEMTAGAHHFVVWEYLGKDRDPAHFWTGLKDAPGCVGLGPRDGFATNANLFGMQSAHAKVRFPPGVAVRLEPHAPVYLNAHLRNGSLTDALTAGAVFNMIPARRGTVRHHAQALVIGSFAIDIAPRSGASFTGEWHTPVALNIVQLSTHQHHRGTHTAVHEVDATGADLGELFAADSWDHPGERWFDRAHRLPAGHGLRFTCDWMNPDDKEVHFGVHTDDEMCFATGYFYPDDESVPVTGPGCQAQGAGLECFVPKLS